MSQKSKTASIPPQNKETNTSGSIASERQKQSGVDKKVPPTTKPTTAKEETAKPATTYKCTCPKNGESCAETYTGNCKHNPNTNPTIHHTPEFWDKLNTGFGTKIGFSRLKEIENTTASPVVPAGTSGMTVGTGNDFKSKDICKEYTVGGKTYALSDGLKQILSKCLCKKGACACKCIQENPFTLTPEQVEELDQWSMAQQYSELRNLWNKDNPNIKFEDLPEEFQTLIFSRKYQSGYSVRNVGFGNAADKAKMNVHYVKFIDEVQQGRYHEAIPYYFEVVNVKPEGINLEKPSRVYTEYLWIEEWKKANPLSPKK